MCSLGNCERGVPVRPATLEQLRAAGAPAQAR
jgi:hypothetical protein